MAPEMRSDAAVNPGDGPGAASGVLPAGGDTPAAGAAQGSRNGEAPVTAAAAPCELEGVISAAEAQRTADSIAACQLANGMIPWFEGGHCDPWNHTEAAMALAAAGRRAEAEAAYQWLADTQRPDGSWHQYYTTGGVSQDKLDANVIAYVATGVWHHWLCHQDRGFAEQMWPVVCEALEFVLGLQTPRGEILWARHADGTPWPYALLTGSSSISMSLRCGLNLATALGRERPAWQEALDRLVRTIRDRRDAFAPKDRWAMDWYYPVLAGVVRGTQATRMLAQRRDWFVIEGRGVRCVSDKDWVTTAETSECAMAHLAAGDTTTARRLLECTRALRCEDGRYYTGVVYPQQVTFPDGERSTYSAAAVLLAADACRTGSPTATLFTTTHSPPN